MRLFGRCKETCIGLKADDAAHGRIESESRMAVGSRMRPGSRLRRGGPWRIFGAVLKCFQGGPRRGKREKPGRRSMRALALVMIAAILTGLGAVPALAYGSGATKQEVLYINLNGDGSVDGIYVVNVFDISDAGEIIDYGDYTALRNMTTEDEIQFDNQTVKIDTDAKKLYYEGRLNSSVIPWIFEIRYYLNGTEYSSDQLAGKSGSLKITLDIRQNPDCSSTFFDHYALQATFMLDTGKCDSIMAEGSTQANVGKNRQITYTVLPGQEKNLEITADVQDFEMDGIAINGVSMSLDVDVDVSDNEDINDLQDGAVDLNDGAHELNTGAGKLEDGASGLVDGAKKLRDGTDELSDGANELKDGADTLHDGAQSLNDGAGDLVDGADDLADGSQTLYDGAGDLYDGLQVLQDGARELDHGIGKLEDGASDLKDGARSLENGASRLYSGLNTLTGQNSDIQTMSSTLYGAALSQYAAFLGANGYSVGSDTTLDELSGMMERRQGELTGGSEQAEATQSAVESRLTTLQGIVGSPSGYPEDEVIAAQAGIDYWNMTLAIQGEEAYQAELDAYGLEEKEDSAYYPMHEAYLSYLSAYGSGEALTAAYGELSDAVGEAEQQAVSALVYAMLQDEAAGDSIYQALAVLSYYKGIIEYTNGVASAASGADTLRWGSESLYDGAAELYKGASSLKDGSESLLDGIGDLMDGTAELRDGTLELHDGALTLSDGVVTLKDGTQDLLDGVNDLQDGTVSLCDGAITLRDGTLALLDGAIELHDGTVKLHDGMVDLVDGTIELCDKTTDASLNEKIKKAIDDALGIGDFTPVSFVSDRNSDVDSVQFVIKTPDIAFEEAEIVQPPAAQLNLWQKFLSLFGMYHA